MSECADSVVGGVKHGRRGIHRERERETQTGRPGGGRDSLKNKIRSVI